MKVPYWYLGWKTDLRTPHKVTLHDSRNAGGCQHVRPWLATLPPPGGSAWTLS